MEWFGAWHHLPRGEYRHHESLSDIVTTDCPKDVKVELLIGMWLHPYLVQFAEVDVPLHGPLDCLRECIIVFELLLGDVWKATQNYFLATRAPFREDERLDSGVGQSIAFGLSVVPLS